MNDPEKTSQIISPFLMKETSFHHMMMKEWMIISSRKTQVENNNVDLSGGGMPGEKVLVWKTTR